MFSFKASHKGALAMAMAMVTRMEDNNNNNTIGLISKTTTARASYVTFLYISFLSLHNYHIKTPNFMDNFSSLLSLNLSAVPKKSTPLKFAYI